jgi:hypothetical protein
MKKFTHMGTYPSASFGVFGAVSKAVKSAATKAKGIPSALNTATAAPPQTSNLDRILGIGTLASIPFGLASLALPSADVRAVENMRKMDLAREAQGLKPLATTPQMVAEAAQKAKQSAATTSTVNGVMTANPAPTKLPGELPPGSMRRAA